MSVVAMGDQDDDVEVVLAAVNRLDRTTRWRRTQAFPLDFLAHHPQGITRVGDKLVLSSVEILEPPTRRAEPVDGYDRTAGAGRGHLFELDLCGRLLRETAIGEDSMYHPGGIDFDGQWVWVPLSEYRPDSRAVVYRVDPATLEPTEAFRFQDHLGGLVRDRDTGLLYAATWGSAALLTFTTDGTLVRRVQNHGRFIDFQGCVTVGGGRVISTGVVEYPLDSGGVFSLGGILVSDVETGYVQHEVPMTLTSPTGRVMTFNAVHLEVVDHSRVLRMYAVPDDGLEPGQSTLFVLDTDLC